MLHRLAIPAYFALVALSSILALGQTGSSQQVSQTSVSIPSTISAPAASVSVAQHPVKSYHDGSVRDIDAIGNRNIGCQRSMGNWYSIEKQIAMGKEYSMQVESTSKLVRDPVITEYVN